MTISLFPLLSSHPSSSFADLISFLSLFPLSVFLSRTSLVLISIYSFSFSHQLYYFGILFGLNRLSTRVCYFFLLVFGSAFWLWPRVIGALLVNWRGDRFCCWYKVTLSTVRFHNHVCNRMLCLIIGRKAESVYLCAIFDNRLKAKNMAYDATRASDRTCGELSPRKWALDCKGHHERSTGLGLFWASGQNGPCGLNRLVGPHG